MKLTDEMIAKAAGDYEQSTLDSLSVTEHTFSPAFERRMKRLVRRQEQSVGYVYFKRVMCAILAIVLCVGTFLMFHTEARAVVVDWLRRQFAHSTYYGPTDGVHTHIQPSRERPAYYELDWLPEGYDLRSRHMTNEDGSVVYGSDANEIELQYYFATKSTHVYVSNDSCEVRYVSVHDGGADLYLAFAEGQSNKLVWYSEDRSVIFVLTAPCGEETLIRMAESVRGSKDEKAVLRYDLGWLPEGCTFESCNSTREDGSVQYRDKHYSIKLSYDFDTTIGGIYGDGKEKCVTVNGYTARLYVYTYDNMILGSSLIWKDEEQNVVFCLSADRTEEELIKIAENIIPVQ